MRLLQTVTSILLVAVSVLFSYTGYSQLVQDQWTWVKGNNTVDQVGIYGTQGTASATNKPGARERSVSWTDGSGSLWLFGGNGYTANGLARLNDLWRYNPSTNQWTWVKGDNIGAQVGVYGTQGTASTTNKPGARTGSVTWTDGSGNLWLFGGYGYATAIGFSYLNDLWKYTPSTNQWTWVKGDNIGNQTGIYGTQGTVSNTNKPGARGRSVSWTDGSGNLWLFGGEGYATANEYSDLNDLWKYTPSTNQWTWVKGDNIGNQAGVYGTQGTASTTNKPGSRYASVSWTDGSGSLWLFGGNGLAVDNFETTLNDLWRYNPSTNQWTWVKGDNVGVQVGIYGIQGTASTTNKPGARTESVSWTDSSGNLWLFGGEGYVVNGVATLNDLWKFTPSTNQWTWVKGDNSIGAFSGMYGIYGTQGTASTTNKPGSRYASVSWTDGNGNLWLFGGGGNAANEVGRLNDLWKYALPTSIFIEPKLYTSKGTLNVAETQTITGRNFTVGGQVNLSIENSSGDLIPVNTITYLPNGGFLYDLPITASMPHGEYNVYAKDINSGKIATTKFRVNNALATTAILKITSPNINTTSKINSFIKIEWTDKPSHTSTLIPNTSRVNTTYKIEYNRNNTGWHSIETKTYYAIYQQERSFPFSYTPSQTGTYRFRVTDVLNALSTDISEIVTVSTETTGVVMNFEWDFSGNRPTKKPIGVVTDGTARIYVKILKKAGNPKTISNVSIAVRDSSNLSITESRLLGKLMKAIDTSSYSIEANTATNTSTSSSISGAGNIFWFWYVSPDDFVRNNGDDFLSIRELNLVANVTYSDNSTDPVSAKIEIVRPPLMFVHGIGGNETTWDNLQYKMNGTNRYFTKESDSRWKFRKALNMHAGGSYKQNAQLLLSLTIYGEVHSNVDINESYKIQSFQYFLKQMRDKGYANNRVEYIAHSMGGVMARTEINYYSAEYKPNETVKRKFKNYGKGFINKLITLNTPHNGSPFADLTIEKLSQNYIVKKLLQTGHDYSSFTFLLGSFFNKIEGTNKLDFNNPTEALKNLQYGSKGVKLLESRVKNHLISGDLLVGGQDCLDLYNEIKNDKEIGLFSKMFAAIGATECIGVNQIFVPYGVTDFIENSDLIVPLSSELPGKNLLGSGNNYSIYYGTKSNHMSIYNSIKNPLVGQKVFELLNAPINSSNFAETIEPNNSAGTEIYRNTGINSISEYIDSNKIVIMQSLRDSTIAIDSSFIIPIKLKDTANFKVLNLLFQGNIYTSTSKIDLQSFNVQVSATSVNSQTIVATAIYDSSGTNIYYTDTLSVNVKGDTVLNGFYVTPDTKILNSGQAYTPSYNLIHNTYISSISIVDTALHIAVADTNVVTYSISSGNFIAKDTGTTYVVISYKQFKDTLFIYISSPTDQNIVKACSQSNLSFFAGSNDSTKNYQWQVDAANGFENISPTAVYFGTDSSTLTLNNVPTNWYNHKYRCIISDSIGGTTSEVFTLKFATTWIGNSDTAWENPANWSCAALPDSNTDVTISSTATRFPQVNTNVSCRSLTIQHGAAVLVKTGYKIDIKGRDE